MSHKVLDSNLVATRKSKVALKLNKPAYIGMCILVLSKIFLINKFHYDNIKNKSGNKSKLLFINIDSLMYETKTKDVYKVVAAKKK